MPLATLVLDADRALPVVRPHAEPFGHVVGIARRRHVLPEVQVLHLAALGVGERTRQIAVRREVAVEIGPGPARRC